MIDLERVKIEQKKKEREKAFKENFGDDDVDWAVSDHPVENKTRVAGSGSMGIGPVPRSSEIRGGGMISSKTPT